MPAEPAEPARAFEAMALSSPPAPHPWPAPDPFTLSDAASASMHAGQQNGPCEPSSLLDPLARSELWPPLHPPSSVRLRSRSASHPHHSLDPPAHAAHDPDAPPPPAMPLADLAPLLSRLSLPAPGTALGTAPGTGPGTGPDMDLLSPTLGSNPTSPRQQYMNSNLLSPPLSGQPVMPRPLGAYPHPPPPGPLLATRFGRQDPNEEITTVFLAGFPEDITKREFNNYFVFARGFEASSLTFPPPAPTEEPLSAGSAPPVAGQSRNRPDQIIGFAKFRTRADAVAARDYLNGRLVDPERGAVLKTEMAKKNLHVKSSTRSLSPPAVPRPVSMGEAFFPPGEPMRSHRPSVAPGPSSFSSPLGAPAPLFPRNSLGEASALAAGPLLRSGTLSPVPPRAVSPMGPLSNSNSRAPSPHFPPRWTDGVASPPFLSPTLDVPDPLGEYMRSPRGQWPPQPPLPRAGLALEPGLESAGVLEQVKH